jgi:hypothetical protein
MLLLAQYFFNISLLLIDLFEELSYEIKVDSFKFQLIFKPETQNAEK